jgi:quinoprotein glucose dehydrogenase
VSDEPNTPPSLRRLLPWLALAVFLAAAVLAVLWVSAEAKRVQRFQQFPIISTNAAAPARPDLLAGFREALNGGDPVAGRNLFFNKPEASCGKCHRVGGQGGDNGPALDGIGSRQTREFILESMVAPNAHISEGYASIVVRLRNGSGVAGVLRQESPNQLVIHTPDDGLINVPKADVLERSPGMSPMPADFPKLISPAELRDLVAFLATLTTNAAAPK